MLRGVIFDIDGTLVASNEAHALSWMDTLREAGHDVPFDVIWPMIGMGGDKLLPTAAGIEADAPLGKRLSKRRWQIFQRDYLPGLKPTPGARALVERMSEDGLKLVVATSAGGKELRPLLEAAGVADLFSRRCHRAMPRSPNRILTSSRQRCARADCVRNSSSCSVTHRTTWRRQSART
ncbi:MAG: HAD family hydrolase [Gemmatimonadales bacterium]